MNWAPLVQAPLAVKLHLLTVVPAFVLGTWLIFFSTKGARLHRRIGVLYLILISATAIITLFVHQLMPHGPFWGFSPIHLLVFLTLSGAITAYLAARAHNVAGHRRTMLAVYIGGMLVAGALTLLPGRLLHAVFLGG